MKILSLSLSPTVHPSLSLDPSPSLLLAVTLPPLASRNSQLNIHLSFSFLFRDQSLFPSPSFLLALAVSGVVNIARHCRVTFLPFSSHLCSLRLYHNSPPASGAWRRSLKHFANQFNPINIKPFQFRTHLTVK